MHFRVFLYFHKMCWRIKYFIDISLFSLYSIQNYRIKTTIQIKILLFFVSYYLLIHFIYKDLMRTKRAKYLMIAKHVHNEKNMDNTFVLKIILRIKY